MLIYIHLRTGKNMPCMILKGSQEERKEVRKKAMWKEPAFLQTGNKFMTNSAECSITG